MHGHTRKILKSWPRRERAGHDVPRWMALPACDSLLRSFQPHLAPPQVVHSCLVQECGGDPTVGSTSGVSSQSYSSSLYTDCHTEFTPSLVEMKGWSIISVCQEPKWYSQMGKFGPFPWTQCGRADTRTPAGRGPWNAGKELITKESGFF